MTPLGLLDPTLPAPEPAATSATELQVRVHDALASSHRLWLRGQIRTQPPTPSDTPNRRRWWKKNGAVSAPKTVHLEARVGGAVLEADVPVGEAGRFEALFTTPLSTTRRGWRLVRNRLACEGQAADQCAVAVSPPDEARGALVVLLPLAYTWEASGSQELARSEFAGRLTPLLRRFERGPQGVHAIYYVGCVPPDAESRHAELALAASTRGWPHAPFILVPAGQDRTPAVLDEALDRLRWLFAGSLELTVLNLEPSAETMLAAHRGPREDRAEVRCLLKPDEDPWKQLGRCNGAAHTSWRGGLRPTRARLVPRRPVVFCHGMLAFSRLHGDMPENLNCFSPLAEFLRDRGCQVLCPQVSATGSVVERAEQLAQQIRDWTSDPVNLVAHSMGGLDARYVITHLGMAPQVATLTTIATPHRGTYLADWFHETYRQRVPLLTAFEALGINTDGFRDCRLAACEAFNARTPDSPAVRYFSYAGDVAHARVSPVLRRAWNILTPVEGANDGMVSVASARWGEFLGYLHADHFAQTPDNRFTRPGEDFDALGFYARLIEDLARRGF